MCCCWSCIISRELCLPFGHSAFCRPRRHRAGGEILPRGWRVGAGGVCGSWGPVCWRRHPWGVGVPWVPASWSGACRPQGLQGRRRPSRPACWCSRTRLCAAELERGRSSCWQPALRATCINCLSQIRTTLLRSFGFLEGWFLRGEKKKKEGLW